MKHLKFISFSFVFLLVGQMLFVPQAHAIWRSIAITHSTVTLMQILVWNPQVERWNIKPKNMLNPSLKARLYAMRQMAPKSPGEPLELSQSMRRKIVLAVGAIESRLAYGTINNRPAGGGIAYGYLQVLSRHGGLQQLLSLYASLHGKYAKELLSFGPTTSERVVRRRRFQELLDLAGSDPIMQQAQTIYFSKEYFVPTLNFARSLNVQEPATYLILFDTFVHYGHQPWLQTMLAKLFHQYGEHKAMLKFLMWMRYNLHVKYTKTYGRGSLQVKYNQWRVFFLRKIWFYHTKLTGELRVHAPQWRDPIIIP